MDYFLNSDTKQEAQKYWEQCVNFETQLVASLEKLNLEQPSTHERAAAAKSFYTERFHEPLPVDNSARDPAEDLSNALVYCQHKNNVRNNLKTWMDSLEETFDDHDPFICTLKPLIQAAYDNELHGKTVFISDNRAGATRLHKENNNFNHIIDCLQTRKVSSESTPLTDEQRQLIKSMFETSLDWSIKFKTKHSKWTCFTGELDALINALTLANTTAEDERVSSLIEKLKNTHEAVQKNTTFDITDACQSVENLVLDSEKMFQHEPNLWSEIYRSIVVFFTHVGANLQILDEATRDHYLENAKPTAQKHFEHSQIKITFFDQQNQRKRAPCIPLCLEHTLPEPF
ncbi:MAG: hypothetical protein P1U36_07380 [Legionellaceae bacterium]|nr:hypothetical protein [Legionellaceae bacterium]